MHLRTRTYVVDHTYVRTCNRIICSVNVSVASTRYVCAYLHHTPAAPVLSETEIASNDVCTHLTPIPIDPSIDSTTNSKSTTFQRQRSYVSMRFSILSSIPFRYPTATNYRMHRANGEIIKMRLKYQLSSRVYSICVRCRCLI